jgi:hypothetical protein
MQLADILFARTLCGQNFLAAITEALESRKFIVCD